MFKPHRITRGPLKGHYYKSNKGYRSALDKFFDRDIAKEERYTELWLAMVEQKGYAYARKNKKKFNELYRWARGKNWDGCPKVYNGKRAGPREAPYAYLLDLVGLRPIEEFGWRCIGDS